MNNKTSLGPAMGLAFGLSLIFAILPLNALAQEKSPNPPHQNVTFEPCQHNKHGTVFYGAECAQISLPAGNNAPQTTLNVLKARARSTPTQDPLIIITGGPGTSAVALAWQYLRFFHAVQKDRDILFIDQRGTGKSVPFNCESISTLDQTLPSTQLVSAMNSALIECAKTYNTAEHPLSAITTRQAAQDIENVRQRLGYTHVNLWGSSYGTRVAMEYQHLFPTSSRTVIIDGVAPGTIALPRHAETDAAHALQQLFVACNDQPACANTFGDLNLKWQAIIERLHKSPVTAELLHPRTQEALAVTVTAPLIANWVRFALYNRELSALLPIAINAAFLRDYQPLSNLAQIASDSVSDSMSYGMHAAIVCAEDHHAPEITRTIINGLPAMPFDELNDLSPACQSFPNNNSQETLQSLFAPITSSIPTLLLSGQFDPVTPPFWAEWASQNMDNAKHIIVKGGHHGVSGTGCMPKLIAQFIAEKNIQRLDTTCIEKMAPVEFFIDSAGPSMNEKDVPSINEHIEKTDKNALKASNAQGAIHDNR
jgi:pimeloyl-ACP methyl ester carboxylesterase